MAVYHPSKVRTPVRIRYPAFEKIMNSQKLKDKFPAVYRDFFSRCQKVVSAPHSFFWTGDFSGFYGGLTILSKLPLRFYIGLEEIEKGSFEINPEIISYIPANKKFSKARLDDYLIKELSYLMGEVLKGYKIHFLTEITLGTSLGGLGAMSSCLAKLTGKEKIFEAGWKIARELQRGRTSGATTFNAIYNSPYPIVFFSKGEKFWGKKLSDIFHLPAVPIWPIDFGLIFSGNLVQGAAVIASAEEIKKDLEKKEKQIADALKSDYENSFWQTNLKMLNQIANQNLIAFSELFQKGTGDDTLEFFFNTLNQYQNMLHFWKISTPQIDAVYSQIHIISNKSENNTGSGAKITGVGKGGEVLFVVPFGGYREKIEQQIKRLKYNIDYTSWDDGFEEKGLVLEQDISTLKFAQFLPKGALLLKTYQKNHLSTLLCCEKDLALYAKKIDLLLDKTSGKIFLKGKKTNSSSLPSQKATIEILNKLLVCQERLLKNTQLPKSYAENRYDLQSKITIPLSRLTNLRFEIKGGMYENYSLSLKPFDIEIGIVEKVL